MSLMPGALWKPLAANWDAQPRMRGHDIICIHTMVGGLDGTDSLFRVNNGPGYDGTESHFGTGGDGRIVQWQDIAFQADANYLGNGVVISIENADHGPEFPTWTGSDVPPLTAAQVEANAQIVAWASSPAAHADCPPTWACHREGIPLTLTPDALPGRRGVAPHRLGVPGYMAAGAVQWSTSRGKACPGDRRIAQIPQIIARAQQIRGGTPASASPSEEDEMRPIFIAAPGRGHALVWPGFKKDLPGGPDGQEELNAAIAEFGPFTTLATRDFDVRVALRMNTQIAGVTEIATSVAKAVSGADIDEAALGQAVVAGLLPQLTAALAERTGATREDIEQAVRDVFADAANPRD